jgi:hypothetical protein
MSRIILTIILITSFINIIIYLKPVHAASPLQLLRVSPVIIDISLSPGKTTDYDIKVDNLTDSPLPVSASVENFDVGGTDGSYTFPATSRTDLLKNWISINNPDAIIPAKSQKVFHISITVPAQVAVGGYYAMLFFSPLNPRNLTQTVIPRIGVLTLANLGVPDPNAPAGTKVKITEFAFDHDIYAKPPVSWHILVANTSLFTFTAKPILHFTPLLLGKSAEIVMTEKIIFPGKTRIFTQTSDTNQVKSGIYNIKLTTSIGAGQQVYAEKMLIILPLFQIIMILILILTLIFLFIRRRIIKKVLKILFHP